MGNLFKGVGKLVTKTVYYGTVAVIGGFIGAATMDSVFHGGRHFIEYADKIEEGPTLP